MNELCWKTQGAMVLSRGAKEGPAKCPSRPAEHQINIKIAPTYPMVHEINFTYATSLCKRFPRKLIPITGGAGTLQMPLLVCLKRHNWQNLFHKFTLALHCKTYFTDDTAMLHIWEWSVAERLQAIWNYLLTLSSCCSTMAVSVKGGNLQQHHTKSKWRAAV